MIQKLLIANRGEIACRIARTCRTLGIATATVHSTDDRTTCHVRAIGESVEIGGGPAAESYLNGAAIVGAALSLGADAVHPGIGFLSEDPGFARAVEDAGLVFVGPKPETLERFADKAAARAEAAAVGVPVIDGGAAGSADAKELVRQVRALAAPGLLKAVAGGGGRGIRIVGDGESIDDTVAAAMREAGAAFGRPDLLVERYLAGARHIEVQIAGDGEGKVLHLYERECSLQRRYQKVVEEAPAPGLDAAVRASLQDAACRLGERAAYRGLGTVEFLVQGDEFFFLEVNPRLQVEHPVSEMITGLDLVEMQLRIAAGDGLAMTQDAVAVSGHAIEARVYAEDASAGFAPSVGDIRRLAFPGGGVRVDTGVAAGDTITPHYDPMIAKLIAHGADRGQAMATLRTALAGSLVLGVETNIRFLCCLLDHPDVVRGAVDNGFIDRHLETFAAPVGAAPSALFAVSGCLRLLADRLGPATDPWTASPFTGWRLGTGIARPTRKPSLVVRIGEEARTLASSPIDGDGRWHVRVDDEPMVLRLEPTLDDEFLVTVGDTAMRVHALVDGDTVYVDGALGSATARVSLYVADSDADRAPREGRLLAPVMGQVTKVHVGVGDRVAAGDILVVQESMKMELRLTAPCDGIIAELGCAEGDMIARHSFVVEVKPPEAALNA